MKKSFAFLSIIAILSLSACSGRKKGGGCDCPTFGKADTELQKESAAPIPKLRYN